MSCSSSMPASMCLSEAERHDQTMKPSLQLTHIFVKESDQKVAQAWAGEAHLAVLLGATLHLVSAARPRICTSNRGRNFIKVIQCLSPGISSKVIHTIQRCVEAMFFEHVGLICQRHISFAISDS